MTYNFAIYNELVTVGKIKEKEILIVSVGLLRWSLLNVYKIREVFVDLSIECNV